MNWRRVLSIVRKEFLQLRRDPRLLRIVVAAPVVQLLVFGYAVTTDIRHIRTAVYDADNTAVSRQLIERFGRAALRAATLRRCVLAHDGSGYFELDRYARSEQEINHLLDSGEEQMVIRIPFGFARDLSRGRAAPLQIILDGSDSMSAGIIAAYAQGVVSAFSSRIALARIAAGSGPSTGGGTAALPGRLDGRIRVWYNPDLKSVNFMVPGVLCSILLVVTMVLTSVAIVKEREVGTLEQLVVTPIRARELMLGKTIPFVAIGFVDMILILLVASLWFRVPIAGSVALLFALAIVFLLTSLGLGLFISTVSRTQQQATLTSFFFMMPSILLSGFIFPIENMPRAIQWVTYAIPLRYFLVIIRGIFLKGNGLAVLWPQVMALAVFGIVIMGLSALRFSKRLG
jgi:ABC-2 type transport system permease protein